MPRHSWYEQLAFGHILPLILLPPGQLFSKAKRTVYFKDLKDQGDKRVACEARGWEARLGQISWDLTASTRSLDCIPI